MIGTACEVIRIGYRKRWMVLDQDITRAKKKPAAAPMRSRR